MQSLRRLAAAAGSSSGHSLVSTENLASSLFAKDVMRAWTHAARTTWDLHSLRLFSADVSGDGPMNGDGIEVGSSAASPAPPTSAPASALAPPKDLDAALDAWGDAMDKGVLLLNETLECYPVTRVEFYFFSPP